MTVTPFWPYRLPTLPAPAVPPTCLNLPAESLHCKTKQTKHISVVHSLLHSVYRTLHTKTKHKKNNFPNNKNHRSVQKIMHIELKLTVVCKKLSELLKHKTNIILKQNIACRYMRLCYVVCLINPYNKQWLVKKMWSLKLFLIILIWPILLEIHQRHAPSDSIKVITPTWSNTVDTKSTGK